MTNIYRPRKRSFLRDLWFRLTTTKADQALVAAYDQWVADAPESTDGGGPSKQSGRYQGAIDEPTSRGKG